MENPITNIPETIKALQEQITTLKNSETPYQAQIFQKKLDEIIQQLDFLKEEVDNINK